MPRKSLIRRALPGGAVMAVLALAFLLPAGSILATFAAYGYTVGGGGALIGGPDAGMGISTGDDVFVRGTDNGIWLNHFTGSGFSGWSSVGGLANADPGAVANSTDDDVFVRGTDNALWHRHRTSGVWGSWASVGGFLNSGPDADWRPSPSVIDAWVQGGDGAAWYTYSLDGGVTWHAWQSIGGGFKGDPGAVSWGGSRIDVFVRGLDDHLWHNAWTGTSWFGWQDLGGIIIGSPDAASCASGHLNVVAMGADGNYWMDGWNGVSWSWTGPLPGNWTSDPGVVCRPGGASGVDIFGRGTDGGLWTVNEPAS